MQEIILCQTQNPTRTLKIYSKYFKRFNQYFIFPEIRLCGKWLKSLGFKCGQNVTVLTEKNRIIIRNSEKIIVRL
jgi:toxic protein SymE